VRPVVANLVDQSTEAFLGGGDAEFHTEELGKVTLVLPAVQNVAVGDNDAVPFGP